MRELDERHAGELRDYRAQVAATVKDLQNECERHKQTIITSMVSAAAGHGPAGVSVAAMTLVVLVWHGQCTSSLADLSFASPPTGRQPVQARRAPAAVNGAGSGELVLNSFP